jgi:hypothetical protein
MLAGQGHEIEARWRQAAPESKARDEEHYRAAMEARAAHRTEKPRWRRPRVREELAASLRALAVGFSTLLR